MSNSERAYFDGDHCQHCADRDERDRLARIQRDNQRALARARPFSPYPGYDPMDGHDPRVTLSPSNPVRLVL